MLHASPYIKMWEYYMCVCVHKKNINSDIIQTLN